MASMIKLLSGIDLKGGQGVLSFIPFGFFVRLQIRNSQSVRGSTWSEGGVKYVGLWDSDVLDSDLTAVLRKNLAQHRSIVVGCEARPRPCVRPCAEDAAEVGELTSRRWAALHKPADQRQAHLPQTLTRAVLAGGPLQGCRCAARAHVGAP